MTKETKPKQIMHPVKHPKSMSAAEFEAQLAGADARQRDFEESGLLAVSAHYDRAHGRIIIEMSRGLCVGLPVARIAALGALPDDQLARVTVDAAGSGLRWDALDMDVSILGWIEMEFGTEVIKRIAGRGGRASTEAKSEAARANGAKGGRPRKDSERSMNSATGARVTRATGSTGSPKKPAKAR